MERKKYSRALFRQAANIRFFLGISDSNSITVRWAEEKPRCIHINVAWVLRSKSIFSSFFLTWVHESAVLDMVYAGMRKKMALASLAPPHDRHERRKNSQYSILSFHIDSCSRLSGFALDFHNTVWTNTRFHHLLNDRLSIQKFGFENWIDAECEQSLYR